MSRRRRKDKWIQKAVKHPGALQDWFHRNRGKLKRKLGYDPLQRDGDIKPRAISDTLKLVKNGKLRVTDTTLRRLYLARTLLKLSRKRKG